MGVKARPKQFLELNGKAIIIHTLEHFEYHPQIDAIAVVCLEDWIPHLRMLLERHNMKKVQWLVPGGATGQQSIRNGLNALADDALVPDDAFVLMHDGVQYTRTICETCFFSSPLSMRMTWASLLFSSCYLPSCSSFLRFGSFLYKS